MRPLPNQLLTYQKVKITGKRSFFYFILLSLPITLRYLIHCLLFQYRLSCGEAN